MGVACGPGYTLQILALPPHNSPAHAVGFPLLSLTRPARKPSKVNAPTTSLHFLSGPLMDTRNNVMYIFPFNFTA